MIYCIRSMRCILVYMRRQERADTGRESSAPPPSRHLRPHTATRPHAILWNLPAWSLGRLCCPSKTVQTVPLQKAREATNAQGTKARKHSQQNQLEAYLNQISLETAIQNYALRFQQYTISRSSLRVTTKSPPIVPPVPSIPFPGNIFYDICPIANPTKVLEVMFQPRFSCKVGRVHSAP